MVILYEKEFCFSNQIESVIIQKNSLPYFKPTFRYNQDIVPNCFRGGTVLNATSFIRINEGNLSPQFYSDH